MNKGRFHRSMQSAFGPYCDNRLQPMADPRGSRADRALSVVLAVVLGALIAAYLLHEFAKGY